MIKFQDQISEWETLKGVRRDDLRGEREIKWQRVPYQT